MKTLQNHIEPKKAWAANVRSRGFVLSGQNPKLWKWKSYDQMNKNSRPHKRMYQKDDEKERLSTEPFAAKAW